jgi:hypothetical protein
LACCAADATGHGPELVVQKVMVSNGLCCCALQRCGAELCGTKLWLPQKNSCFNNVLAQLSCLLLFSIPAGLLLSLLLWLVSYPAQIKLQVQQKSNIIEGAAFRALQRTWQ